MHACVHLCGGIFMCSFVTRNGPWGLPDQTHTEQSTMQADVMRRVCVVLSVLVALALTLTLTVALTPTFFQLLLSVDSLANTGLCHFHWLRPWIGPKHVESPFKVDSLVWFSWSLACVVAVLWPMFTLWWLQWCFNVYIHTYIRTYSHAYIHSDHYIALCYCLPFLLLTCPLTVITCLPA